MLFEGIKRKKHMKGQSAMEYLLTYGWAIAMILAIMSILYYYVFKPEFYVQERCDLAPGLDCDRFLLTANETDARFTIIMHNTMGFAIYPYSIVITTIDLVQPGEYSYYNPRVITTPGATRVETGENITVEQDISIVPGTKVPKSGELYKIKFVMTYLNKDVDPATTHKTAGVINVRVS